MSSGCAASWATYAPTDSVIRTYRCSSLLICVQNTSFDGCDVVSRATRTIPADRGSAVPHKVQEVEQKVHSYEAVKCLPHRPCPTIVAGEGPPSRTLRIATTIVMHAERRRHQGGVVRVSTISRVGISSTEAGEEMVRSRDIPGPGRVP
jgi:hypothetical protein